MHGPDCSCPHCDPESAALLRDLTAGRYDAYKRRLDANQLRALAGAPSRHEPPVPSLADALRRTPDASSRLTETLSQRSKIAAVQTPTPTTTVASPPCPCHKENK